MEKEYSGDRFVMLLLRGGDLPKDKWLFGRNVGIGSARLRLINEESTLQHS